MEAMMTTFDEEFMFTEHEHEATKARLALRKRLVRMIAEWIEVPAGHMAVVRSVANGDWFHALVWSPIDGFLTAEVFVPESRVLVNFSTLDGGMDWIANAADRDGAVLT